MTVFDFTYWRAPLDPAAPFYRRQKYGPWETSTADLSDGVWTVVMSGLDAATVASLVEVPGPSFHYLAASDGGWMTYWRIVSDWHPDQPPVPHETIWFDGDGEWREGPFPSENVMLSRYRVPAPGHPPHLLTREQRDLWYTRGKRLIVPEGQVDLRVYGFRRFCEAEGLPDPAPALVEAEIQLEDEIAGENAAEQRQWEAEGEIAIAKIKRGWEIPADPAAYWPMFQAAADEVPARGLISDALWLEAARALADRVIADRGLPPKMSWEHALLALGIHPCTGRPFYSDADESRTLLLYQSFGPIPLAAGG